MRELLTLPPQPRCAAARIEPITRPALEQCPNQVVPGMTLCREHLELRFRWPPLALVESQA